MARQRRIDPAPDRTDPADGYKEQLRDLQIELVKLQRKVIADGLRLAVVLEGRDAAGKDGMLKRVTAHMSPRETRVVALGKPTDRDRGSWYFQRYVPHLPAAGEIVLFNRSWYNRAGVEPVMGFCTDDQYEAFLESVPVFEQMLIRDGVQLRKYYLDISRAEQRRRLKERRSDPLTQWKVSPLDAVADAHWKDYSRHRDVMFARTHSVAAPWIVVRADDKKAARLNLIRHLLLHVDYDDRDTTRLLPDEDVVFPYSDAARKAGKLSR